ncbi:uncharacterized protein BX663DRAFT_525106 [Cokeromyces recurvatus]|uniref:uncharacterized protein n=1 Tax=Cokeromyces recurvatus TaxID=90255 RepID=UPI00221FA247|nr:uncharacterized protein BX663DRAFT_525106 [Cokeromyces recurvatus]KAI7898376.1 hypothetical protein BX663DRAFT_525106 [Cokeromyces recurvatus]
MTHYILYILKILFRRRSSRIQRVKLPFNYLFKSEIMVLHGLDFLILYNLAIIQEPRIGSSIGFCFCFFFAFSLSRFSSNIFFPFLLVSL